MARLKDDTTGGFIILNDADQEVGRGGLDRLLATTGPAGKALVNGTAVILTWTAPNDGQLHRVKIISFLDVPSDETGGDVQVVPGDGGYAWNAHNGSKGAGHYHILDGGPADIILLPGTSISLNQTQPLTGGAAKIYAEFWGS